MTEVYKGIYTKEHGCTVTVNDKPLPNRSDLTNESPTGFEWGHDGSGPAQLALAILAYHCSSNEQHALNHCQAFKERVIAHIPANISWQIDSDFIEHTLLTLERGKSHD
jgi:hypothetical protein